MFSPVELLWKIRSSSDRLAPLHGRNAIGTSWSQRDGDDSEHELGGETMSVKVVVRRQAQAGGNAARSTGCTEPSLKAVAGRRPRVKNVLVIDVGGTSVSILATGQPESRSFRSGPKLTPSRMVSGVKKLAANWTYDVVSIGYPGPVLGGRPSAEPVNLGRGWIGFDFAQAFGRPVKVINDAAMQAFGSYQGGEDAVSGSGKRNSAPP